MILRYTPEALEDLRLINEYISKDLKNPLAAKRIIKEIVKSVSYLKEQPRLGINLSAKTGRDTDLLYIISGNHIVFYRIDDKYVSIIRIINARTNYLQVIFCNT